MKAIRTIQLFGLIAAAAFMTACNGSGANKNPETDNSNSSKKSGDPTVVIHELGDPDRMNPLTSTSAGARYIQENIYSRLLQYDPISLELKPQLAKARPEIAEINDGEYKGGMSLTYEIHAEAVWDDGKPVTAYDFVFSIKATKNPLVNAGSLRPYCEFMSDIVVDPSNPKKFVIYSKQRYFAAEESAVDFFVLPEHIYDAEGLMKKITVKQLNTSKFDDLSNNADIKRFAEQFNAPKFDREVVVGSGAYKYAEWTTGQYIILERKKDWWGDKVKGNDLLTAYPTKITYKIIPDQNTAITSAKDEAIDVMRGIQPKHFVELKEDNKFQKNFELSTPDQFAYYYIGFNSKDPKFSDKRVRRAIAHLVKRDEIIESLFEGMAIKTNSPVNPNKPYYNKNLKDIDYDIEKAKALLAEAGWVDSDKNGILDKVIGGKKVEMRIKYKFNQGNEVRKNIGVLLQEHAEKVGIRVELDPREWTVFLEDTKRRDFDIMCLAWIQGPGLDDMKQIWHSESNTRDGSNRVGFGTPESDKLIENIRQSLDEKARTDMYMRLQEIIYEEQPYVFLCVPSERIAIHNRFKNTETSALRPGYREAGFALKSADIQ